MDDLLHNIFHDLREGEFIEAQFHSADRQSVIQKFFTSVEALQQELDHYKRYHCYFGVAPRGERNGRKESITRLTCLWAETDAKDYGDDLDLALTKTRLFPLPPSYIIASGHGYHCYWLLTEDVDPIKGEKLLQGIKRMIGGDHVWNCNRLMRIPGTLNVKDPQNPLPCVVHYQSGYRYSVGDIESVLAQNERILAALRTGAPLTPKGDRSTRDFVIIESLRKAGMSHDTIYVLYNELPVGDKHRERPRGDYLDLTISKAEAKLGASVAQGLFLERADSYVTSDGTVLSTFTYHPNRLIRAEGGGEDSFVGTIRSGGEEWENVVLSKSAFNRVDRMNSALNRVQWQWLGSDKQLRHLLPYLVAQWESGGSSTAQATTTIGRHEHYWVIPGEVLTAKGTVPISEAPYVYTETGRPHHDVWLPECSDEEYTNLLSHLNDLLPQINRHEVLYPILGWFMACPFKITLNNFSNPVRFPHLCVWGTKGSGKSSTILKAFLPLLGVREPHSHNCATTEFILMSLMASTNGLPVSLTEFRRSTLIDRVYENLKRTLLMSYDYGEDHRGRANQTAVTYTLHAPLVLDGEDVIDDPAIRERTIFCNFSPDTVAEHTPAWKAFDQLSQLPIHLFARRYIQFSLSFTPAKLNTLWNHCMEEIRKAFNFTVADRVRRNLATVLMGIRLWEMHLNNYGVKVPKMDAGVLRSSLAEVHSIQMGRSTVMVDEFCGELVDHILINKSTDFTYKYDPNDHVLWFHLRSAVNWWIGDRRRRGQKALDLSAIRAQLKEVYIVEDKPLLGRYIRPPKTTYIHTGQAPQYLYGLDMKAAYDAGLDIPEKLNLKEVTFHIATDK